jgi:protein TonB
VLGAGAILLGAAVLQSALIVVPGSRNRSANPGSEAPAAAASASTSADQDHADHPQAEPTAKATAPEPATSEPPQTGALPDVAPAADRPAADAANPATPAPNAADPAASERAEPPTPPIASAPGIEPAPPSAAPAQSAEAPNGPSEPTSANQTVSTETQAAATPESEPIVGDAKAEAPSEVQSGAAPSQQAEPPAMEGASEAKPEPAQVPATPYNAPMVRSANAETSSEVQPSAATSQPTEPPPLAKSVPSEQQSEPPQAGRAEKAKQADRAEKAKQAGRAEKAKETLAPQAQGKPKSKPMTLGAGLASSKSLFDAARRGAAGYGAKVRAAIGRHKPKTVGASGSATVSFAIGPAGGLQSLRINRSSGKAQLDEAALASVRNAAPFAPPPAGIRPSYSIQIFFR